MSGGKKIEIIRQANNHKLAGEVLGLSHKNVYGKSHLEAKDLRVKEAIEATFVKHPAYGHRRLAIKLGLNRKKILRIMKKFNLKPPRLWYHKRYLTQANNVYRNEFKNLISDITNPDLGEIWASDLTYIKYQDKFYYLATIRDLSTGEIVGYNLGDRHDGNLVLATLKEAVLKVGKPPRIFHSDRGREFLNEGCLAYLKSQGIQVSVSDPGSPWQNGQAESFFSRFKGESGDLNRFESFGELVEYVFQYVNYYNNERIVTRLKMSPVSYRESLRKSS